jgi:hypothetical protein
MSQQENKKEESKAKNKKDDNIPPKNRPVYDQELSQDQCEKIISIIKSHFIPEEILFRIRPELKESYISRKDDNLEIDSLIKIPLEKMNEEERFLHAYLCKKNLYNDIPSLIEHLNIMFEKLENPSDKETIDNILEIAISNYYASKIRLYSEDAANDSFDEEYEKEMEEKRKNRIPLTEEEAQKEIAELQEFPLFMTELPEHPENNIYLQSFQALQYEGKPDEVGLDFLKSSKENLDKYKKTKKFNDLKEAMIDICNAIDHCENDPECNHIKFRIYYHRGTMQVMVKNWRYAVGDLSESIKYIKDMNQNEFDNELKEGHIDDAYLKLIKSYIEIKLFSKAKELIKQRKKVDEKEGLKSYKDKYINMEKDIENLKQKLLDDLSKMEAFKNMENEKQIKLYDELTSKGIKLENQIVNIPSGYQAEIYKDEENKYHFPILVLYEEFNMTDYIQDFAEDRLVSDILEIIFEDGNLPWDKEHRYSKSNCNLYLKCSKIHPITKIEESFYYPIRNDESLIKVLSCKKVHMNGFPIICVVSPMSYNYYEHFLKKNIILKRNIIYTKKYNKK